MTTFKLGSKWSFLLLLLSLSLVRMLKFWVCGLGPSEQFPYLSVLQSLCRHPTLQDSARFRLKEVLHQSLRASEPEYALQLSVCLDPVVLVQGKPRATSVAVRLCAHPMVRLVDRTSSKDSLFIACGGLTEKEPTRWATPSIVPPPDERQD